MTNSDQNFYFFLALNRWAVLLHCRPETLICRFACVLLSFRLIGCDKAAPRQKNGRKSFPLINFKFNLNQKRLFSNCSEVNKNIYNNYSKRLENKWNIRFATLQCPYEFYLKWRYDRRSGNCDLSNCKLPRTHGLCVSAAVLYQLNYEDPHISRPICNAPSNSETKCWFPLTRFWLRTLTHLNFNHVHKIEAR